MRSGPGEAIVSVRCGEEESGWGEKTKLPNLIRPDQKKERGNATCVSFLLIGIFLEQFFVVAALVSFSPKSSIGGVAITRGDLGRRKRVRTRRVANSLLFTSLSLQTLDSDLYQPRHDIIGPIRCFRGIEPATAACDSLLRAIATRPGLSTRLRHLDEDLEKLSLSISSKTLSQL